MAKYYLVYDGYQKYRDGSVRKRKRVVRLGNLVRPKIEEVKIDKPTRRGIVVISHSVRVKSTKLPRTRVKKSFVPATTYKRERGKHYIHRSAYERSSYIRKGYRRKSYIVRKTFSVTLGDYRKGSIRITRNPPKGPLMD